MVVVSVSVRKIKFYFFIVGKNGVFCLLFVLELVVMEAISIQKFLSVVVVSIVVGSSFRTEDKATN
jgi:hypothetical protein